MRGRLIVVGGHSRRVGKTSLITAMLPLLEPGQWIATKISRHQHHHGGARFSVVEEHSRTGVTATSRLLAAGAGRAFLLRAVDSEMDQAAAWVQTQLTRGLNVIAESNRLVRHLRPDLLLFVVSPGTQDWKASSTECLDMADALVITGNGDLPAIQRKHVAGWVPRIRFFPGQAPTAVDLTLKRLAYGRPGLRLQEPYPADTALQAIGPEAAPAGDRDDAGLAHRGTGGQHLAPHSAGRYRSVELREILGPSGS